METSLTDMSEHDKSLVSSQISLARFNPRSRRELAVRGLLALSEARDANFYFFKGEEHRILGEKRLIRAAFAVASSYYEKALEIDPEHKDSLFAQGWCIPLHVGKHGDWGKAFDNLILQRHLGFQNAATYS